MNIAIGPWMKHYGKKYKKNIRIGIFFILIHVD